MENKKLFTLATGLPDVASASDEQVRDFVCRHMAWAGIDLVFAAGSAEEQAELLRLCCEAIKTNREVVVDFCYDGELDNGRRQPFRFSLL